MPSVNYSLIIAVVLGYIIGMVCPAQYVIAIAFCAGVLVGLSFSESFKLELELEKIKPSSKGWFDA